MFKSDTPKEKLSNYGAMNTPPAGKKHRLSRFLGSKEDREGVPGPTIQPDSAYASSDNAGHNDIVQVENDGSIPNTNKSQHLALDKGTGEVFDEDTGEVVTVVTTTTTTTTTTTVRGNQKHQDVHKDVQKDVQTTSTQHPHGPGMTTAAHDDPGASMLYKTQPPRDSGYSSGLTPEIPARSSRRSGEYNVSPNLSGEVPTSSSQHNFSYPGRNHPTGTTTSLPREEETAARRPGRFADLKAAAIGLHGVGETLRGTLNKEIDTRYPSKNAEKAAMISAKNDSVLDRGRHEMSGIPRHDRQQYHDQTPISPVTDHDAAYSRQNLNPSSTQGDRHLDTSPSPADLPQTTHDGSSISNLTTSSGTGTYHPPRGTAVRADSSYAPETVSGNVERVSAPVPSTTGQGNTTMSESENIGTTGDTFGTTGETGVKKQGTLSKLFKRKPVGGEPVTETERKKYY